MTKKAPAIRRSFALPRSLVEEAAKLAPRELQDNLNRLVVVSLQEFVERRRRAAFEQAMARMASDPPFRSECAAIAGEFAAAEQDGLKHD